MHKDFLEFSNIDDILQRLQDPNEFNSTSSSEPANISSSRTSVSPSDVKVDMELKSPQPSQSEISIQTVISKKAANQSAQAATSPNSELSPHCSESKASKKLTFMEEMKLVMSKCCVYIRSLIVQWMIVFWRLWEIHILKLVFLCTVIISIKDVRLSIRCGFQ